MYITIRPNELGHLELEPTYSIDRKIVAKSNAYDGTYSVYLQDEQSINDMLNKLDKLKRYNIDNGWECVLKMDAWEFRHMVGGQSD